MLTKNPITYLQDQLAQLTLVDVLRVAIPTVIALFLAVLAAWAQLGEVPSAAELTGMFLIGGALTILAFRGMRRHEAVESAMGQD